MTSSARRSLIFALFTVSGFAGLIYESLWTHYLKLFLGHAAYSQTLVLAIFMGGMAIGAWLASRMSAGWRNLLRGYAVVEAIIGLAAIFFHPVYIAATDAALASWLPAAGTEGAASAIKWSLAALLVLPQSILLGMTFPLMSGGLLRRHPERPGEAVSFLYFTNSLGAAVGVLASGFILIDRFGLTGSMQLAGAINLVLAAIVWFVAPGRDPAPTPPAPGERLDPLAAPLGLMLLIAALTGTASFIYEIVWIRMLSLVLGSSTHSFELMLSSFILGIALGGWWIRRRIDRLAQPVRFLAGVQVIMGLAALATIPLYDLMFDVMATLIAGLAKTNAGYTFFLLGSHAIALVIMIPATFCAGMTLPLITYSLLRAGHGERSIGRVYSANTLGSIVGVWLAAHVGLPMLGLKGTLLAGALLDAALGVLLLARIGDRPGRTVTVGAICAALFATMGLGATMDGNKMASGVFRRGEIYTDSDAKLVYYRDGKTTSVSVLDFSGTLSLRTNGKSDGAINLDPAGERVGDESTMVMTAAIPLAIKPEATEVAVIGIGTGLTTHTLLASPAIERVDTIEIEPFMAEASRLFRPLNVNTYADPRSNIVFDDAKTYFSTRNGRYDVIVSEPSNPWVSGVASLFTAEFYRHVRRYLKPGGLLVQWFQLYEIDPTLVASVLRALGEQFPDYAIYAATDSDLMIVAGDAASVHRPMTDILGVPAIANELNRINIRAIGDVELRRIGSKAVLSPFFATYGVPANSDFRPFLDQSAARYRFLQTSSRELTSLGMDAIPVLGLLDDRAPTSHAPAATGQDTADRAEIVRKARYALAFFTAAEPPEPRAIPTQFQKDIELLRMRAVDCREAHKHDIWLHSARQVAQVVNVGLSREDATELWSRAKNAPCYAEHAPLTRAWLDLHAAIGERDGETMHRLATRLLTEDKELTSALRVYLVTAAIAGALRNKDPDAAAAAWKANLEKTIRGNIDNNLRILYGQLAESGKLSGAIPVD